MFIYFLDYFLRESVSQSGKFALHCVEQDIFNLSSTYLCFFFKVFRMYVTYHVPEYIHFVGFLACHPVFPMRNITTATKCNYEDENVIKTFKFYKVFTTFNCYFYACSKPESQSTHMQTLSRSWSFCLKATQFCNVVLKSKCYLQQRSHFGAHVLRRNKIIKHIYYAKPLTFSGHICHSSQRWARSTVFYLKN